MVAEIILVPQDRSALESAKTTAQYAARGFSSVGVKVREQISLCMEKSELQSAIAAALGRSNVVLVLGGQLPQQEYMSKTVVAEGLGLPLETDRACLAAIQDYCRRTGEPYRPEDSELARLPRGSVMFPGQHGKVPGFALSSSTQHILVLPDSAQEIAPMLRTHVLPYLSGRETDASVTRTVRTYGMREEQVREKLSSLMNAPNPAVTVERDGNEVLVRVTARAAMGQEAAARCTPVLRSIVDRLGDAAYGLDVDSLQTAVVAKLRKKGLEIAVAEAGSGGMLTRIIGETEGGADILRYSVAVDSESAKQEKLNISPRTLGRHGPVSEQAAVRMATAAREKAGTDIGVAITASSRSQQVKKRPLGLIYIAVCNREHVYVKKLLVGGKEPGQDLIVDAAVSRALNMVRLFVDYLPGPYGGAIPLGEALRGRTVTDQAGLDDCGDGDEPRNGFFRRLGENFLIRKTDERGVKVRKFVFIVAVLVFLGAAGYLGMYYYEAFANKHQTAKLQELFEYGDTDGVNLEEVDLPARYSERFAALYGINQDVVGYLRIEDTQVAYPVVQAEDNNYYLRRDFYQKTNQHGIPFMDYRVDVELPSDNMVIYGHNMKDGQMFGELINYKDVAYYKEHPVIEFSTVYRDERYKIFSVFITNAYTSQGPVFAYHNFIERKNDEDFMSFVDQVKARSLINTTVDVNADDELLTLSTCTYEFEEARFVVVARKVRRGEDEAVDTSGAVLNPQPLMPDIWYKTFGGQKPSGVDHASVVTAAAAIQPPSSTAPSSSAASSQAVTTSASSVSSTASSAAPAASSAAPSGSSQQSGGSSSPSSQASSSPPSSSQAPPSSSQSDRLDLNGGDNPSGSTSSRSSSEPSDDSDGTGRGPDDLILPTAASAGEYHLLQPLATDSDGIITFHASPDKTDDAVTFRAAPGGSASSSGGSRGGDDLDLSFNDGGGSGNSGSARAAVADKLSVYSGGGYVQLDAAELIARVVQAEMGGTFHTEALKAQAVAAYSFILFHNNSGTSPSMALAKESAITDKVRSAVDEVIGEAVYYNGKIAFTPFHATSAGNTTSSRDVWGGSYAYLVPVESPVDQRAAYYAVKSTMSSGRVADLLYSKLGIAADGDPSDWFEVLTTADGGYNGDMSVCGYTKSQITGAKLTGRVLRESVLSLRSACFEVDYDSDTDTFTFVTYGYGHGVGMSQNGANFYAQDGWDYREILTHYYSGTEVL